MEHEIVFLEEKNVAGFSARTNNSSPEMGTVIGGLWQKLYRNRGFHGYGGFRGEKRCPSGRF